MKKFLILMLSIFLVFNIVNAISPLHFLVEDKDLVESTSGDYCGSAARIYDNSEDEFNGELCENSVVNEQPGFPDEGEAISWQCVAENNPGNVLETCEAEKLSAEETCSEKNGQECIPGETCTGTTVVASDTADCCLDSCTLQSETCSGTEPTWQYAYGPSKLKKGANDKQNSWTYVNKPESSLDSCEWTCTGNYHKQGNTCIEDGAVAPDPDIPDDGSTCKDKGGTDCTGGVLGECKGNIISASDTTQCCSGTCEMIQDSSRTCKNQGGEICAAYEFCSGGYLAHYGNHFCCAGECYKPSDLSGYEQKVREEGDYLCMPGEIPVEFSSSIYQVRKDQWMQGKDKDCIDLAANARLQYYDSNNQKTNIINVDEHDNFYFEIICDKCDYEGDINVPIFYSGEDVYTNEMLQYSNNQKTKMHRLNLINLFYDTPTYGPEIAFRMHLCSDKNGNGKLDGSQNGYCSKDSVSSDVYIGGKTLYFIDHNTCGGYFADVIGKRLKLNTDSGYLGELEFNSDFKLIDGFCHKGDVTYHYNGESFELGYTQTDSGDIKIWPRDFSDEIKYWFVKYQADKNELKLIKEVKDFQCKMGSEGTIPDTDYKCKNQQMVIFSSYDPGSIVQDCYDQKTKDSFDLRCSESGNWLKENIESPCAYPEDVLGNPGGKTLSGDSHAYIQLKDLSTVIYGKCEDANWKNVQNYDCKALKGINTDEDFALSLCWNYHIKWFDRFENCLDKEELDRYCTRK